MTTTSPRPRLANEPTPGRLPSADLLVHLLWEAPAETRAEFMRFAGRLAPAGFEQEFSLDLDQMVRDMETAGTAARDRRGCAGTTEGCPVAG